MNAMKRTVICAAAALCALVSFGANDTFGNWAKDVLRKDGKATWKTGKLSSYAASYQKKIDKDAANYEARILHAATLLAQLGENATFQAYVKKFGYTLDYLKMSPKGKLAATTPIGKALMGHRKGDVVEVNVPAGLLKFEVLNISI